jgi:hypothetical protein
MATTALPSCYEDGGSCHNCSRRSVRITDGVTAANEPPSTSRERDVCGENHSVDDHKYHFEKKYIDKRKIGQIYERRGKGDVEDHGFRVAERQSQTSCEKAKAFPPQLFFVLRRQLRRGSPKFEC